MPEDNPKSNMDIATDALKAEIAEEVTKPTPNWAKIQKLTKFLQSQRVEDAIREDLAAYAASNPPGVGAYVTEEDDDSEPNNFILPGRMRRARTPTMPTIPADIKGLIDKLMEMSPFQAGKAKKMLECANLLDVRPPIENREKRAAVTEFTAKLREKAMDILRPELGGMTEEVKPAIRKLDLEDEVDADFEVK